MDIKKTKRFLLGLAVSYWLLVIMIYAVAHEQFHYTAITSDALTASDTLGEVVDGMTVTQNIIAPADQIASIDIMAGTYLRDNNGTMHISIIDESGNILIQKSVDVSTFYNDIYTNIHFDVPAQTVEGEQYSLVLTTTGCTFGNAVTFYCGNSIVSGRYEIVKEIKANEVVMVNGQRGNGMLCIKLNCIKRQNFYLKYWVIVVLAFLMITTMCVYWWRKAQNGKNNPLVAICVLYVRYAFLIKQLVSRDFKTKYKRSTLGMAWSFLNPLLTMAVQYIVFSTLFKSDIPNYPVYLLSGIVFFNFFSEAVSMGMTSITGNASLIKKVYMPKYIYPVSRILSSLINFSLAIIPLFLVMIITGTAYTPALLLLVFDILCLLGFVLGMGLLLTTAMTFFQDTQFLWSVISMMWMYLTPVFYPENIIPTKYLAIYHLNPMYQYITFARTCILDGVSPEPMAYLWCIVSSLIVLLLGIVTFKKYQDRFVLYL